MKTRPASSISAVARLLLVLTLVCAWGAQPAWGQQTAPSAYRLDIAGPPGSGSFGNTVRALPNGNIVVTDPYYDAGTVLDVGAVYVYDGGTGTLISRLTGTAAEDKVGSSGVTVLANGHFVVSSSRWDDGTIVDAGAVTWANGTTGITGTVSAANSLVGGSSFDGVGSDGVVALPNGHYVVSSQSWSNGPASRAGAVTWGNGTTGITGTVSAANSLVGSTPVDQVGSHGLTVLANGDFLVRSLWWKNGSVLNAGAVTWGNGTTGIVGPVSAANSLVGSTAGDRVGSDGVTELANGNYVVRSLEWHNGAASNAGAVTWGSGATGIAGAVSPANSLVGSTAGERVGDRVTALANGHYVVCSWYWDNGPVLNVGAATWGNGTTGITGTVSVTNSLVGSTALDQVANGGVTALANGNYVVGSPYWDNGAVVDAGAATWGNGTTGITGTVSAANSLVGSAGWDGVGYGVTALRNGHYVVSSPRWHNGAVGVAGAATWGNGTTGITGNVSAANSLVGSSVGDQVGYTGVIALSDGHYVVGSPGWSNGPASGAGAATWGNGETGITGAVSAANSLVGSSSFDGVASAVTALSSGNYVVSSPDWSNGPVSRAGAVTWGKGTTGITGIVSAANSLVGSTYGDRVGSFPVTTLSNGNYVVHSQDWSSGPMSKAGAVTWGNGANGITGPVSTANSLVGSNADRDSGVWVTALSGGPYVVSIPYWDNGATANAGAVTWGNGSAAIRGPITSQNSVLGVTAGGGQMMRWAYDSTHNQLVVGRPFDNIVTLFRPSDLVFPVFLPLVVRVAVVGERLPPAAAGGCARQSRRQPTPPTSASSTRTSVVRRESRLMKACTRPARRNRADPPRPFTGAPALLGRKYRLPSSILVVQSARAAAVGFLFRPAPIACSLSRAPLSTQLTG